MSRSIITSLESQFRSYQAYGRDALAQVPDALLNQQLSAESNTLASLVRHISGNLQSRFSDFLTTDGEKPDRHRDSEFSSEPLSRAELDSLWQQGWQVLFQTLAGLEDTHLSQTVHIRRQPLSVAEALHRSLAHTAGHVGQILFLAKILTGPSWHYLSIAPGQSEAYNRNPLPEKP